MVSSDPTHLPLVSKQLPGVAFANRYVSVCARYVPLGGAAAAATIGTTATAAAADRLRPKKSSRLVLPASTNFLVDCGLWRDSFQEGLENTALALAWPGGGVLM